MNDRIRVREVLLIDDDGSKRTMPAFEALALARDRGLDLVEVAPTAAPPVCRILDYGKFKYEQAKKEREAHKHQKQATLREVRFKPKIGQHDIDVKKRVVEGLLAGGDKVKVSVMFRGREITHPEIGRELLLGISAKLKDVAIVERQPSMEGRFMNMYLAPVPPKQEPKVKTPRAPKPTAEAAPDGAAPPDTAIAAAFEAAQQGPAAE
ncbi:MAG: translation initiation factor IF-3 [Dehalococcoidia bacterium]